MTENVQVKHAHTDALVNADLRDIVTTDEGWARRDDSVFYHQWADILNQEFFRGELPQAVISFDRTRRDRLGHYVFGRNGDGHKFTINLNTAWLHRPACQVLSTLLHEQIHLWQDITGLRGAAPNYHNKAFVKQAAEYGLIVKRGRGCHLAPPTGRFVALLQKHGIAIDWSDVEGPESKARLLNFACDGSTPDCIVIRAHRDPNDTCNNCGVKRRQV